MTHGISFGGRRAAVLALLLLLSLLPALADAAPAVPQGYRIVSSETLDAGIEHSVLRRDNPPEEVHVARLGPGQAGRLRTVLAADVLSGPGSGLETTSSMCLRTRCVVAVNGDFTDGARQPVGGMVSGGELLRSSWIPHAYLAAAGGQAFVGQDFRWAADLRLGGHVVPIASVNRPQAAEGPTLYTSRWGPSTGTDPSTTELVAALPPGAPSPLPSGQTPVRLVELRAGGNGPIGPGQVVVAARGAAAGMLTTLWQSGQGNPLATPVLGASTDGAHDTLGGSPQLLSNGQIAFPTGSRDSFTQDRHPRTLVGVTPAGETLLVTVDGRQPGHSHGLTLPEAADLLRGMGATDAINLDGGGSTSFVAGGALRNRPSDAGGERRVISALVVVPPEFQAHAPLAATPVAAPAPLPLNDPASRPPNLVGDLLPPLRKALGQLAPIMRPMTDTVLGAVDEVVNASKQASGQGP